MEFQNENLVATLSNVIYRNLEPIKYISNGQSSYRWYMRTHWEYSQSLHIQMLLLKAAFLMIKVFKLIFKTRGFYFR